MAAWTATIPARPARQRRLPRGGPRVGARLAVPPAWSQERGQPVAGRRRRTPPPPRTAPPRTRRARSLARAPRLPVPGHRAAWTGRSLAGTRAARTIRPPSTRCGPGTQDGARSRRARGTGAGPGRGTSRRLAVRSGPSVPPRAPRLATVWQVTQAVAPLASATRPSNRSSPRRSSPGRGGSRVTHRVRGVGGRSSGGEVVEQGGDAFDREVEIGHPLSAVLPVERRGRGVAGADLGF